MQIAAALEQFVILTRVTFRYRTVALRDRGRCQPTVVSLPNDRSALRHVLACLGLGFPAKSVPEQANRDCTSPVTESCSSKDVVRCLPTGRTRHQAGVRCAFPSQEVLCQRATSLRRASARGPNWKAMPSP